MPRSRACVRNRRPSGTLIPAPRSEARGGACVIDRVFSSSCCVCAMSFCFDFFCRCLLLRCVAAFMVTRAATLELQLRRPRRATRGAPRQVLPRGDRQGALCGRRPSFLGRRFFRCPNRLWWLLDVSSPNVSPQALLDREGDFPQNGHRIPLFGEADESARAAHVHIDTCRTTVHLKPYSYLCPLTPAAPWPTLCAH